AGLLRERLFAERTCVLTSATLQLGGDFAAVARSVGLRLRDRVDAPVEDAAAATEPPARPDGEVESLPWRALDVGSPFDYRRQAICYVARRLRSPGRDGISAEALDELTGLMEAAGGRTLGL